MDSRRSRTRKQAEECTMSGGALPEHSDKECCKQRRIHKGKYEL